MLGAMVQPGIGKEADVALTTRIALVVEYDGTAYYGSQLQADLPTIQSELEKALENLTGEQVRVALASRTDAGVHARGQVVSFKTTSALTLEAYVHGLNHHLPDDIAVLSAHRAALSFDPRRMAVSREYTYTVLNRATRSPLTARFAHRVPAVLDIGVMDRASKILVGLHDFASFASELSGEPEKSTTRHLHQAGVVKNYDSVVLSFTANAFLRHQVRSMAGALVQVGLSKMSLEEFSQLLDAKQPGLAGPLLPACGLCLVRVNYPCAIEEMR